MAHDTRSSGFGKNTAISTPYNAASSGLRGLYFLAALLAIAIAVPIAIMTAQTAPL